MKNILVGIDFNEHSDRLIDKSVELAKAFGAKIWLLHVSAPDPDFVGYEAGPQFIRNERAKELKRENSALSDYASSLRSSGIDAEGLLIQGPTIETIISESNKLHIDLIICGHHKHNYLYNKLFGSFAKEIVLKSTIPVMVIPIEKAES